MHLLSTVAQDLGAKAMHSEAVHENHSTAQHSTAFEAFVHAPEC